MIVLLKLLLNNTCGKCLVDSLYLQFTPSLPKTRSGKIMRRILRKIAANQPDELGDTSTLLDPSVVDILVDKHKQSQAQL